MADRPNLQHGEVLVVSASEKYQQNIYTDSHHIIADEPESLGGKNLGPNPYEFLLAGLGACTSMTLRMYADRKKWPLEGVKVNLSHQKIHAKDCKECETEKGKVDLIVKEITLAGPLDSEQKTRLMEIAEKCPVNRTLLAEIKIEAELINP